MEGTILLSPPVKAPMLPKLAKFRDLARCKLLPNELSRTARVTIKVSEGRHR